MCIIRLTTTTCSTIKNSVNRSQHNVLRVDIWLLIRDEEEEGVDRHGNGLQEIRSSIVWHFYAFYSLQGLGAGTWKITMPNGNKPLLLTSKEREIIDLYFACCFSTFGTANLKVLNRDVGQSKSHLFSCQVAGDFLTERSILLFIRTALYICTKALNDFNATGQISATRDQLQDRAKQTIAANVRTR